MRRITNAEAARLRLIRPALSEVNTRLGDVETGITLACEHETIDPRCHVCRLDEMLEVATNLLDVIADDLDRALESGPDVRPEGGR